MSTGTPCPVPGCVRTGPHDRHVTATGATFTRTIGHGDLRTLEIRQPDRGPDYMRAIVAKECPHCGEPDDDPTPEPRIVWPCCGYVAPSPEERAAAESWAAKVRGLLTEPNPAHTTDPAWVRQIRGAFPGRPVRVLATGPADQYTAEMAEHRANLFRAQGYTDVSVSVHLPPPAPPLEQCPACKEWGGHDRTCDLPTYHLRAYLRTAADPTSTADQVAAALNLLTEDDRALVTAPIPTTRPKD